MGDTTQPTHEVFISYAKADKRWADAACAVLEAHRIRCWIAPRDITPGTEWGASIIAGIDGCKLMVLIFSTRANESPQVRREVERVISKGLDVLSCRVEDVKPVGSMEFALSITHWLDAFTPPVERQMNLLAQSVQALLQPDGGAAEAPFAPPAVSPELEQARRLVRKPAMALLLMGCLALAFNLLATIMAGARAGLGYGLLGLIFSGFSLTSALAIWGGVNMITLRNHRLALAGSIAMMASFYLLASIPIGIWCVMVLRKSDVRSAFGEETSPSFLDHAVDTSAARLNRLQARLANSFGGSDPTVTAAVSADLEEALRLVRMPAVTLMVMGCLASVFNLSMTIGGCVSANSSDGSYLYFFSFLTSALAIWGGTSMIKFRNYRLAMAGSIAIMASFYLLASIPIGCWCVAVLREPEVLSAFGKACGFVATPAEQGSRWKRKLKIPVWGLIVTGAIFAILSLLPIIITLVNPPKNDDVPDVLLASLTFISVSALVSASGFYIRRMRRYKLVLVCTIVSVFTVLASPFAIWALILLFRRGVRESFDAGKPKPQAVSPPAIKAECTDGMLPST